MGATVNIEELSTALKKVSLGMDSQEKMLTYQTIAFYVEEGGLILTTMGRAMHVQARVAAEGFDKEEMFGIRGEVINKLVPALKGESVTFKLTDKQVHVTAGKSKYKLNRIDNGVLPRTLSLGSTEFKGLVMSRFLNKLDKVDICCNQTSDEPNTFTTTVYFDSKKLVGTDRFRIALCNNDVVPMPEGQELFFPLTSAKRVRKMFSDVEGMAKVAYDESEIILNMGDIYAVIRQKSSRFPNYASLFKGMETEKHDWSTYTKGLKEALGRLGTVAGKGFQVDVEFEDKKLYLSAESEHGNADECLSIVESSGNSGLMTFNSSHILDALSKVDEGIVKMNLYPNGENRFKLLIHEGDYEHVLLSIDKVRRLAEGS